MAYTGTGTQADPYIVDNWTDFMTVENLRYDSFIKWADKEDPAEKVVPAITISSRIDWRSAEIDFNGYVFEQITIDMNYTAGYYPINIMGFEDKKIFNWHVSKWDIKNAQISIFSKLISLYSCYFDNLSCRPVASNNILWTRSSSSPGVRVLSNCIFYYSVIKTYTEECNMIIPSATFYNSELYVNYKYTGNTAISSKHSVFFTVEPTFIDSYVSGEIDVSEGSGSFAITDPIKSGGIWVTGAYYSNTIFNIKFKVSANCTISAYSSNTTFQAYTGNVKSYFTIDNGNNSSGLSSIPVALSCSVNDIKNAQTLITDQFPHIEDNNVRYPQYSTDRSAENWVWHQVDDVNSGIPFQPFYFYPTRIIPRYDTDRGYISVYDISEPQDGYQHNGVAVLSPSEIISTKEDKGRWDIEIVHPIDKWGKWTYIVGQNVVKVNGQLFRIDETETYLDADSEYITAHAKHITYDMSDVWINEANFTADGGSDYYIKLYASRVREFPNQQHVVGEYVFNVTSDITGTMECAIEDQNLIEALFGADNSFINRYGGELYRDNFNMTINQHLEGADNAFSIRYGQDLTKISFKIDFSQWITNLICVDNFGSLVGVWYDTSGDWMVHHHKTKRVHFTYAELVDPDYAIERLDKDTMNLWAQVSTPIISIEIKVAAIKNDPKYKDFLNLQNFDVGYSGQIYVEHLGIDVSMKIVSIRRNELTGEAISITLGNSRGSLIRQTVLSQTIVPNGSIEAKQEAAIQQVQQELFDTNTKIMSQSIANMEEYAISEIEKRSVAQLEGLI